jgi:hypothetical protein
MQMAWSDTKATPLADGYLDGNMVSENSFLG